MLKGTTFLGLVSESFSLSGLFSAELSLARERRWTGRSNQRHSLLASLRLFIPVAERQRARPQASINQHSSRGVSRASLVHTHLGSPPGIREALLRNLIANSRTAWLGQSVTGE